jgi:hypothetical protein
MKVALCAGIVPPTAWGGLRFPSGKEGRAGFSDVNWAFDTALFGAQTANLYLGGSAIHGEVGGFSSHGFGAVRD